MDARFAAFAETLQPSFLKLISQTPVSGGKLPRAMPKRGVYLFSEGEHRLYVGRSNNMRARYGRHCNPGTTHRMAAFAFRLVPKDSAAAKELVGRTLTTLHNKPPSWLTLIHEEQDAAVAAAYGWPPTIDTEEALENIFSISTALALRPERPTSAQACR